MPAILNAQSGTSKPRVRPLEKPGGVPTTKCLKIQYAWNNRHGISCLQRAPDNVFMPPAFET